MPEPESYIKVSDFLPGYKATTCLAVTENGQLAIGGNGSMEGTNGVFISNLNGNSIISIPERGFTTALAWIRLRDVDHEILVYGTNMGHLVVWKEIRGEKIVCFFV